jgi:hypothetical protein
MIASESNAVAVAKAIVTKTPPPNTHTYAKMPGISASNTFSIMLLTEGASEM